MPTFVAPEAVRFELWDGVPVIILDVGVPTEVVTEEWSVVNRPTVVSVDGPGGAGFVLPRIVLGSDVAPAGWDDAVQQVAGSRVVFGTGVGAPAIFARSLG